MIRILIATVILLGGCSKKCEYIGCEYLGKPYLLGALGEEKAPGTGPLIRTDAFDCVTFVETSLAGGDLEKLTKIRYKNGEIDFMTRNHFTEYDWIGNNDWLVENVSAQYGKAATINAVIDKQAWFKKSHGIDADIKPVKIALEYIPYENLQQMEITESMIAMFVRDNPAMREKIGSDLVIVHLGFLLPGGTLRHASSDARKVVDVDFYEYAADRAKDHKNKGIALFRIKESK
ncbi:MAG: DUF1460 domain-containing protein [Alphaproteobacteria bacterium]|nr:DUF1460 domain-containing protein [Alphaproteobacteria bacterium]